MHIYHDSRNKDTRCPFGARPVNTELKLSLYAENARKVQLNCYNDTSCEHFACEMPLEKDNKFSCSIKLPEYGCLIWYHFTLYGNDGKTYIYAGPKDCLGGEGCISEGNPDDFQITVYEPQKVPAWYKEGIAYQIFPDRFNRGSDCFKRIKASGRELCPWDKAPSYDKNPDGSIRKWDFYGGTLKGITEKLNHLKALGITVLYINPIFEAVSSHRYDTADYMKIDPLLGDDESFKELCREAKRRGINIILDGVFNHTGVNSIYFKEGSPYRDWFIYKEDEPGYECWWGVKDLPEINEDVPSYREYICGKNGVVRHWLRMGAKGFRLDVADELPDSMIQDIRKALKEEDPDAVLLGEVWEDASNKESHGEKRKYFMGRELDSVMNYPLRHILMDFAEFKDSSALSGKRLMSQMENYPPENFYANFNLIDSHDRPRALTRLKDTKDPKKSLMMVSALQYALPGIPCLYYGDEAGVTGGADPENRASYPWSKIDAELFDHYRSLAKLRNSHSCLRNGSFRTIFFDDDILSFLRSNEKEALLMLANRADESKIIEFEGVKYEIPPISTVYAEIY